jgi:histidinol dehydrogenase
MIRRLSTDQSDFEAQLDGLLALEREHDRSIERTVSEIIEQVRARGDAALLELTRHFDVIRAVSASELRIGREECEHALRSLPEAQRTALTLAADRVRVYHDRQRASSWSFQDEEGNELGQRITALDRVGVYVPGGKAAYPSSVLMNVVPAKVAGVREIVMAVPTPEGERNPLVLAAAALAGVDEVYTIGGAQAIAAMAYGTQSLAAVDKIVGPGNAYVAEAKRQVFGTVGIDMIAGPSEILIVSDGTTPPDWLALDLFSQAEHDELAQAILLATDSAHLDAVERSIDAQLPGMGRRDVIAEALRRRGALIKVRDLDQACALVNRIAPEHLELSVEHPDALLPKIRNAGAIFMGRYASESLGDYCAGPNHVLPTSGTARFSSPLGVYDFQKRSSLIRISKNGAVKLGAIAAELARGEGLTAHAKSAECRVKG